MTTPVDAPAVSGHTAAPNVSSPSELSASCDAPAPSHFTPPAVDPLRLHRAANGRPSPRAADLPAPAGMTSEVQSPPAADRPQSAQQAIDTLTQRFGCKPFSGLRSCSEPGNLIVAINGVGGRESLDSRSVIGDGIWLGSQFAASNGHVGPARRCQRRERWCLCPLRSPHQSSCRPCHKP